MDADLRSSLCDGEDGSKAMVGNEMDGFFLPKFVKIMADGYNISKYFLDYPRLVDHQRQWQRVLN